MRSHMITWSGGGLQVHGAEGLHGHIDVVHMVEDHSLLPEALIGQSGRGQKLLPRGLPLHSDGTHQLTVPRRSSMRGRLKRERDREGERGGRERGRVIERERDREGDGVREREREREREKASAS